MQASRIGFKSSFKFNFKLSWTCVLLLILCTFNVQPARAQTSSAMQLESTLRKQSDAWIAAIVAKDREAIAANMADNFLMIDFDGRQVDKQGFINTVTAIDLVLEPYVLEDVKVRVFANVALIHAANKMRGTYKGQAFTRYYRYTDMYVKEGDVWRVVGVQTTPIK